MVDYKLAFKRPFNSPKEYGILAVLSIPPISYAGWLFTGGYLFDCLKSGGKEEEELPTWSGVLDLLKNSILMMLMTIVYILPGMVFGSLASPNYNPLDMTVEPNPILLLIGTVLLFLAWYLIMAAVSNAAYAKTWSGAYDLGAVFRRAFTVPYLIAFLISAVMIFALIGVISGLASLTALPTWLGATLIALVGGILASYIMAVTFTIFGQVAEEE